MQTADSKSDVLAVEGQTVSGAPALEEEVGFGSSQAQIPPSVSNVSFFQK